MDEDVETTDPEQAQAWLSELEGERVLVTVHRYALLHGDLRLVGPIMSPIRSLPLGTIEYSVGELGDRFYFHPDELDHAERIPAGVVLRLRDGKLPIRVARSSE